MDSAVCYAAVKYDSLRGSWTDVLLPLLIIPDYGLQFRLHGFYQHAFFVRYCGSYWPRFANMDSGSTTIPVLRTRILPGG